MIPFIFAAGIVVAIMAAASRSARAAGPGSRAAAAAPAGTAASVKRIVDSGDPRKMVAAATAAHQAGQPALAAELVKHAKNAAISTAGTYPSPFAAVSAPAWSAFVKGLRGKSQREITPTFNLGLFGFGMRRLVDLGLASNPRQLEFNGKKTWQADWAPALQPGPDKFLDDADAQYKALVKSVTLYAAQIGKELPEVIGSTLDGKPVTLSGLLAVAHRAGWGALKDWISSPDVRAKHTTTTALFNKLNGAF